ncbi:MAG TPA: pyruvate ferredoxin oxidoreductase, partial [Candidatus Moranbacteria bacterium]|nr:pyruvate ferredoxin oxidoreductase [Candidatus Moranbacteria bacterium]
QKRFKHLFAPGNEEVLKGIQNKIDEEWKKLLAKS